MTDSIRVIIRLDMSSRRMKDNRGFSLTKKQVRFRGGASMENSLALPDGTALDLAGT